MKRVYGQETVEIYEVGFYIRVKFSLGGALFENQNINIITNLLEENFNELKNRFLSNIGSTSLINDYDIDKLSIECAIAIMYKFNSWNNLHKKSNYSMRINTDTDLDDICKSFVVKYFKEIKIEDWRAASSLLLGISLVEFDKWYEGWQYHINR